MVRKTLVIGVVALGLAGCSTENSKPTAGSPNSGLRAPQVIVDGQQRPVSGGVTCHQAGDNVTIGIGDISSGVGAVVTTSDPPQVRTVGLGTVDGVALGFTSSEPGEADQAVAAVRGKSYAIKGTASGSDLSNPRSPQQVSKSFEMDVACP
ncbi:lipoprotein LpqH [Mycobacterium sp. SMC-17]